jgi:hypothetical protein
MVLLKFKPSYFYVILSCEEGKSLFHICVVDYSIHGCHTNVEKCLVTLKE